MHRTLLVERRVWGDPAALRRALGADPATWLPDVAAPGPVPGAWQVYLWAGQVAILAELTVGPPVVTPAVCRRRVSWDPGTWLGLRAVPGFAGDLVLRAGEDGQTLVLEGDYQPPGGPSGWLLDRIALRRVAGATGRRLVHGIAGRLQAEVQPFVGDAPA
jgi:hypothetical protein